MTKMSKQVRKTLLYLFLSVAAIIVIFPFIWMLCTAFKPPSEALSLPPTILPKHFTVESFTRLLRKEMFIRFFMNSVIISSVATFVAVFTSALGGYVFAKFQFKGRGALFSLILATTMVPFASYMVPLYLLAVKVHLTDTYLAVMAPLFITGFGIFFMRQNIMSIPNTYIDAARIDGCSETGIFLRIILPLVRAPLSALAIFQFMFSWKFFIWPLIITSSKAKLVLEVGLVMITGQDPLNYSLGMAGVAFTVIPITVVFLVFRRNFIRGITLSGLKY